MGFCRPHHPLAYRTKYMRDKVFHKESICVGYAVCKIHNKSAVYKLADNDRQVTCKRCLAYIKKHPNQGKFK